MEELEARGIDPRNVKIQSVTINTAKKRYNAFHKDDETGKAVVTPMSADARGVTIKISPKFDEAFKWPVIQPAAEMPVVYENKVTPVGPERRVFIWPDTQIGFYRSIQTDELTPFHDLKAIDVALQMLRAGNFDEVVILGDFVDLASMSRWLQIAEFQATTQRALQYAYCLLHKIRGIVGPDAKISYIAGNHERRLAEYTATNAKASSGLRSVETNMDLVDPVTFVPKAWSWPHMSIPEVLHLDTLNIQYTDEYPGGQVWLTPELVCVHAPENNKRLRATVIHGHIPRATVNTETIHYKDGSKEYGQIAVPGLMGTGDVAHDPALLCRGKVASNNARPSWQQGVASVLIFPSGNHEIQVHRIKDGVGIYKGHEFTAAQ